MQSTRGSSVVLLAVLGLAGLLEAGPAAAGWLSELLLLDGQLLDRHLGEALRLDERTYEHLLVLTAVGAVAYALPRLLASGPLMPTLAGVRPLRLTAALRTPAGMPGRAPASQRGPPRTARSRS